MNPRIVGIAGPLNGVILPLTDDEMSIGREPSNKLWAADSAMSRQHCTIVRQEDGQFVLCDLGGRNGTRVNGERIERHELCHQDQISVGNSRLVFLLGEEEAIPHSSWFSWLLSFRRFRHALILRFCPALMS